MISNFLIIKYKSFTLQYDLIHQYFYLFYIDKAYVSKTSINIPWNNNYLSILWIFYGNDNPYIENYYYTQTYKIFKHT